MALTVPPQISVIWQENELAFVFFNLTLSSIMKWLHSTSKEKDMDSKHVIASIYIKFVFQNLLILISEQTANKQT